MSEKRLNAGRKKMRAGIVAIAIFSGLFIVWLIYPILMFQLLKYDLLEDDQRRWVAETLSRSDRGVKLAFSDMSIYGGQTKGAYEIILYESKNQEIIKKELAVIVSDSKKNISERSAAAKILYYLSKDSDVLLEYFDLVKNPGGNDIRMARVYLAGILSEDRLLVDANSPILLTEDEFKDLLD